MWRMLMLALLLGAGSTPLAAAGRVLKLEELTFTDIDRLDRQKSIVLLTFGNLEEHGPHLPVGSDYFQAIAVREGLVERLRRAHPDYDLVLVPIVPLGEGGANDVAFQFDHVGTFAVRFETLRAVALDLGASMARQGFRTVFLTHCHGSPLHNIAFTDAAAFVSEHYKVRMVNLTSLVFGEGFYSSKVMEKYLGKNWEAEIGFEGHAGAAETSANLSARGDLVKPDHTRLPMFKAKDMPEFLRTHERATGWKGYWGAPAKASKAMGKELIEDFADRSFRIAERALAGEDLSRLPVYPLSMPPMPEANVLLQKVGGRYAEQAAAIESWLRKREAAAGPRP